MTTISIVLVVVPVGSRDHGRGSGSVPFSTLDSDARGLTESSRLEGPPRPCAQTQASSSRGHGRGHDDRGRGTKQCQTGGRPVWPPLFQIPGTSTPRRSVSNSLYLEDSTQRTCLPPKKVQAKVQGPPVRHGPSNVHRNLNHALLAWLHAVAWHERGGPACSCSPRAVPVTGLPACRLPWGPSGSRAMSDSHGTFS